MKSSQGILFTIIFWAIAILVVVSLFKWLLKTVIFWAIIIAVGAIILKLSVGTKSKR